MNFLQLMPISLINNFSPEIISIVVFCATTLGTIAIFLAILFVFIHPIYKKGIFSSFYKISQRFLELFILMISGGCVYLLSVLLKNIFSIPRPYLLYHNLHPLLHEIDYGFPSGHASTFSAIATVMFFIDKRAGIVFSVIALIIGVSRVFAGVHTPLDILGGFALGIIFSSFVVWLVKKLTTK